ncbi:MAG: BON domain-containing protein [Rhodospirillales bacterium]
MFLHPLTLRHAVSRTELFVVIAAVFAMTNLTGCVGMIIGGAATAGVAAYQERGIMGVAADTETATRVRAKILEADNQLFSDVGVEVYEGRVLLTGRVPSEEKRAEAVKISWSVVKVKDVINEVAVSENPLLDLANDTWITTKLKSKMTFDKDILAINYSIETVGAVIYLIGIAQDKAELQRVLNHARSIDYVKRVVNHIRIKDPKPS